MGFIDIHTHIIPDTDDGSRSFEDSLKRIDFLRKRGFDKIIATPHKRANLFSFDDVKIRENLHCLVDLLREKDIDVDILVGAEYLFGVDLFEDIEKGNVYTLGGSKYILVEFNSFRFSHQDREGIFRVLTSGYKLIVAHIERQRFNSDAFSALEYLKNNAVLFQCDLMSLSGLWGEEIRLFMEDLIERKYVDILSTDTHCKDFEDELLNRSFERAEELLGDDFMERYMGDNIKKRLGLV